MAETLIERLRLLSEFHWTGDYTRVLAQAAVHRIEELERELALAQQDAERYRWLCDDLNAEERMRRSHILNRMSVMGKGAIDVAIDNIDALPDKEGL